MQVYDPNEDDPYMEYSCTECHGSGDEHLLLLCDLCDSAAHTYCVGLGETVPNYEWYCCDCKTSMNEHSDTQRDAEENYIHTFEPSFPGDCDGYISPSEIVRDQREDESSKPPTRGTQTGERKVNRRTQSDNSHSVVPSSPIVIPGVRKSSSLGSNKSGPGVRTLSRCRDLHGRIRIMRENWDALRSGSMMFSSRNTSGQSSQSHSVSFANDQVMALEKHTGVREESSIDTWDANKAWRMMELAQSMTGRGKGAKSNLRSVDYSAGREVRSTSISLEPKYKLSSGGGIDDSRTKFGGCLAGPILMGSDVSMKRQRSSAGEISALTPSKHRDGLVVPKKMGSDISSNGAKPGGCLAGPILMGSDVSMKRQRSSVGEISALTPSKYRDGLVVPKKMGSDISSNGAKPEILPACNFASLIPAKNSRGLAIHKQMGSDVSSINGVKPAVSSVGDFKMGSDIPFRTKSESSLAPYFAIVTPSKNREKNDQRLVNPGRIGSDISSKRDDPTVSSASISRQMGPDTSTSGSNGGVFRGRERVAKTLMRTSDSNETVRQDHADKSQVQSMVKLNMKLLRKNCELGTDKFKEIARLSTHTILAACGLEHSKSCVQPFSSPNCVHNKQHTASNLMPTCCRECFSFFVRDVVSSIMVNKSRKIDNLC
ncbi:hypothetical protein AMTRI_Chr10g231850 [Amborella trichopoda]